MCVIYLKQPDGKFSIYSTTFKKFIMVNITEIQLGNYIRFRGIEILKEYIDSTITKVKQTGTSDYRKGKDKRTWEALHG